MTFFNSILDAPFHSKLEMIAFWEMHKGELIRERYGGFLLINRAGDAYCGDMEQVYSAYPELRKNPHACDDYLLLIDIQKERIKQEESIRPPSQLHLALK